MNSPNRDLIEQVRKVSKLLSLYVLALQEELALTADDHYGLARALRGVIYTIEQKARKPPFRTSGTPSGERWREMETE